MRNFVQVLLIDVVVPVAVLVALALMGLFLGWPLWWVAVASMLALLVVEGAAQPLPGASRPGQFRHRRRRPRLRLALVGLVTALLVARRWPWGYPGGPCPIGTCAPIPVRWFGWRPPSPEATATFSPRDPDVLDRTGRLDDGPERGAAFGRTSAGRHRTWPAGSFRPRRRRSRPGSEALGPAAAVSPSSCAAPSRHQPAAQPGGARSCG